MNKFSDTKQGFTIIEVLVSVGIMAILLPFAASTLINNKVLASYAKHKIQAAYAAQQIIETLRQQPLSYFAPMLKTVNPVNPPIMEAVVLDTMGNYMNTYCSSNPNLFCGTATITVSGETYTNSGGQQTTYTATYQPPVGVAYTYNTIAHLGVNISWNEQILSLKTPMSIYYATDIIVNDSMLN
jgi:prepilin-type N-terminal cleavage/methylation domain-containing protein